MRPIYTIIDKQKYEDHEPEVLVRWIDRDAHIYLYGVGYLSWLDRPDTDWCRRWCGTLSGMIHRLEEEIKECEPGHYRWGATEHFLKLLQDEEQRRQEGRREK